MYLWLSCQRHPGYAALAGRVCQACRWSSARLAHAGHCRTAVTPTTLVDASGDIMFLAEEYAPCFQQCFVQHAHPGPSGAQSGGVSGSGICDRHSCQFGCRQSLWCQHVQGTVLCSCRFMLCVLLNCWQCSWCARARLAAAYAALASADVEMSRFRLSAFTERFCLFWTSIWCWGQSGGTSSCTSHHS